jgi:hypothetical protein
VIVSINNTEVGSAKQFESAVAKLGQGQAGQRAGAPRRAGQLPADSPCSDVEYLSGSFRIVKDPDVKRTGGRSAPVSAAERIVKSVDATWSRGVEYSDWSHGGHRYMPALTQRLYLRFWQRCDGPRNYPQAVHISLWITRG